MADKFHVGQRVRVKWSYGFPSLAGQIVTLTEQRSMREMFRSKKHKFTYATDYRDDDGCRFCPLEEQLEPADDGWQLTTWDQCMWRPKAREAV